MNDKPIRKRIRLKDFDYSSIKPYLITICTRNKDPLFIDGKLNQQINGISVSTFIGAFKSKSTRIAWTFGIVGKLWQSRFHDKVVRKNEDLHSIGQYILDNPVRKGLVSKWEDYVFLGIIDRWV